MALTKEDALAKLQEGILELTSTEGWLRWLETARKFHNYSWGNQLLIFMQHPDATRVAGFHTWKQVDRSVRKGATGIAILAPLTRKRTVEDDQGEETVVKMLTGFRIVYVFDIADTDGEPLPEGPRSQRLTGDVAGFDQLVDLAKSIGYGLAYEEFKQPSMNGKADFLAKTITLRTNLDMAQSVKTLTHEIAHCLLHSDMTTPREVAELEAESVAYLVCADLGLDSSQYTLPYVAGWSGGGEEACKAIQACGQRIVRTANEILEQLSGSTEEVAA